jgi:predicted anti-sigma-YlaC factor YlaD
MNGEAITSCEDALRLLAGYLDHELGATEHEVVEQHLRRCRSCWSRAEFERRLKVQLGDLRRAGVPPTFEQRIRELIAQFPQSAAPESSPD